MSVNGHKQRFEQPVRWPLAHGIALVMAVLLALAAESAVAQNFGSCTVSASNADIGTVSSLEMAEQNQQSAGVSGLSCSALAVLNVSYIKVLLEDSTFTLVGGPANQTIPFSISSAANGPAMSIGTEVDLSTANVLNLFVGPGGTLPMHFTASATPALRSGTYTGSVQLRWYFSICSVGVGPLCSYSNSPGAARNILGGLSNWGGGVSVTISVTLQVENDCAIDAPALDFGAAPLVGSFSAVTRTINIRCSAGAEYSVGLGNGNHFAAGSRRMRLGATSDYLRYEIFQGVSSSSRWGDQPSERRSSDTAETNPSVYDGSVQQGFTYRAVIDPAQAAPPVGTYVDHVVVDVQF
jgi:spore coat protein U-like protein